MQLHPYLTMQSTIAVPYIDGLYRYAMSITRNPTDAGDLAQKTYVPAILRGHLHFAPSQSYCTEAVH
jgi:DNA-directed RNA polymerase specialized sigma24 family protein